MRVIEEVMVTMETSFTYEGSSNHCLFSDI